ncbi:molybdopterin-dependent oxidoreductase [Serratia ureilytica]
MRAIFTANSPASAPPGGLVCDLSVNRRSGQITLDKIFVAHDCGRMINPAGVRHQVHGNVIQSASRVLKEFVTFNETG